MKTIDTVNKYAMKLSVWELSNWIASLASSADIGNEYSITLSQYDNSEVVGIRIESKALWNLPKEIKK
jgi:hypothetical protein